MRSRRPCRNSRARRGEPLSGCRGRFRGIGRSGGNLRSRFLRRRYGARAVVQTARFSMTLQPLKIGANVGCVLVAEIAILLQSFENDVFKFGWQIAVETNGRRRNALPDASTE